MRYRVQIAFRIRCSRSGGMRWEWLTLWSLGSMARLDGGHATLEEAGAQLGRFADTYQRSPFRLLALPDGEADEAKGKVVAVLDRPVAPDEAPEFMPVDGWVLGVVAGERQAAEVG